MSSDEILREHLDYLLSGGGAHMSFEEVIDGLPAQLRGSKPPLVPYTPWRLVEHMRLSQRDILGFSVDPEYESPEFPDGYWPHEPAPPTPHAWDHSVKQFQADNQAMRELVSNPKISLMAPITHGQGQTILREALLVADHNSYHLGQLIVVRRLLGALETDDEAPDNL